jgi:hypothetical protein
MAEKATVLTSPDSGGSGHIHHFQKGVPVNCLTEMALSYMERNFSKSDLKHSDAEDCTLVLMHTLPCV